MRYLAVILSFMTLLLSSCQTGDPIEPGEPDAVYISEPDDNSDVSGTVTISIGVNSDYDITRVVFYIDNDSVYNDNTSPFAYQWDVTVYEVNSEHTIIVRGYDADTFYVSDVVNVTVSVASANEFEYLGSYQSSDQPFVRVAAENDVVYAAMGTNGLMAIDISDADNPEDIFTFQPGNDIQGVDASGVYLISAEGDAGIRSFDISDNDTVVVENAYNTPSLANNVKIDGNLVYIADNDNLIIVSISNYNFTYVSQIAISTGAVIDVDVLGSTVYILDVAGVTSYDISNLSSPDYDRRYQTFTGECQCISAYGNYVFVGTSAELTMLSSSLSSLAIVSQQQGFTGVYAVDDVVFVSQGGSSGGARAYDYSSGTSLNLLDTYIVNEVCNDITYFDSYVILAGQTKLDILRFEY